MANKLKVQEQEAIKHLTALGWGIRRVARELRVSRNTVRGYVRTQPQVDTASIAEAILTSSAVSTPGSDPPPLQTDPLSTPGNNGRKSLCLDYASLIHSKIEAGLSAQRIFQDLKRCCSPKLTRLCS